MPGPVIGMGTVNGCICLEQAFGPRQLCLPDTSGRSSAAMFMSPMTGFEVNQLLLDIRPW